MNAPRLKLVVLGSGLSSSPDDDHATMYRALLKAMAACGHEILFLERESPRHGTDRDLEDADHCELQFYDSVAGLEAHHARIAQADVVIVGSHVPDGIRVGAFVHTHAAGTAVFYDLDTPATLAAVEAESCAHLAAEQIPAYELYLSVTGGPALQLLETRYGAPAARALHGCVDPTLYAPTGVVPRYDLGYLGVYRADRQALLERLLIEPARRLPEARFIVAGAHYPPDIAFPPNVERFDRVPPRAQAAFYGDCRFTLNVTRADRMRSEQSPSARLFEAAACGTAIISDVRDGLDAYFTPGREIVIAHATEAVVEALTTIGETRRTQIAAAARRRVLAAHTAAHRAAELEHMLVGLRASDRLGARG